VRKKARTYIYRCSLYGNKTRVPIMNQKVTTKSPGCIVIDAAGPIGNISHNDSFYFGKPEVRADMHASLTLLGCPKLCKSRQVVLPEIEVQLFWPPCSSTSKLSFGFRNYNWKVTPQLLPTTSYCSKCHQELWTHLTRP
jgi:hypothetical protein